MTFWVFMAFSNKPKSEACPTRCGKVLLRAPAIRSSHEHIEWKGAALEASLDMKTGS